MAGITKTPLVWAAGGMDLETTLFCGQSFAWQRDGDSFAGVAGRRALRIRQRGDELLLAKPDGGALSAADGDFWARYFALDEDYAALEACLSQNDTLAGCVAHGRGIRVLRQPFFDTLLSFIISQNNHIPRIAGIVERLRATFGDEVGGGLHAFPTPAQLARRPLEALDGLRAGFRAKYLLDAAARVAAGEVSEEALAGLGDDEARALLMKIHGVGPKVADCVLLYGLGRQGVVPMDVWMKRAMAALFPAGMPACAAGREGIAQQYIFCYARDKLPRGK